MYKTVKTLPVKICHLINFLLRQAISELLKLGCPTQVRAKLLGILAIVYIRSMRTTQKTKFEGRVEEPLTEVWTSDVRKRYSKPGLL